MLTVNRVRNQVWGTTVDVEWAKHGRGRPKPQKWLDPVAVDTLRALRARNSAAAQSRERPRLTTAGCSRYDGLGFQPMSGDYVQRRVKRIAELAGLPHRSHDLRHHRATELVAAGVDVGVGRAGTRPSRQVVHPDGRTLARGPAGEGPMASLGQQYLATAAAGEHEGTGSAPRLRSTVAIERLQSTPNADSALVLNQPGRRYVCYLISVLFTAGHLRAP